MEDILRGIFGITVLIAILYLFSANRKAIDWKLVMIALGMQILFGLAVLKVEFIRSIFDIIGKGFINVLDFTKEGAIFVFGGHLMDPGSVGFVFAFQILPTILFFSALSSILYYLGILQRVIYGLAFVMTRVMRLSGAESLAAAANVFIGQTEAPLIVKPYLEKMTKSEILCLMVGGMATIAGGVLAAFIGFLGGDDPVAREEFARHLLTASIMSAPAAILAAKILFPETEEVDTNLEIPKEKIGNNLLEAISNGTTDGLKLAVNVGAMLIVFIALVAMLNSICSSTLGAWVGWTMDGGMSIFAEDPSTAIANQTIRWNVANQQWMIYPKGVLEPSGVADISRISLNMYIDQVTEGRFLSFNLEYILGVVMSPIAWIIGTPSQDILVVGQLLGKKTILNEFVAYADIPSVTFIEHKSKIIATYALCGFANFASIGIQLGGIGAIAPSKRATLAEFGMKALIGGTIACFLTATIAGMMVG